MPQIALVRPPDNSFVTALGQKPDAPAIDMARAEAQHRSYAGALRDAGLEVVVLPPSPGLPDACFVQDVALVLPEGIILAWPAEPTRQGEVAAIRAHLPVDRPWVEIHPPGTLEWGDVLRIDTTFYAGQSARTNAAGTEQLRQALRYGVTTWKHCRCRTGCICSAASTRLAGRHQRRTAQRFWSPGPPMPACRSSPGWTSSLYRSMRRLRPTAWQSASRSSSRPAIPQTEAQIRQRGFRVLSVPVDEFAKADGGVTCLSIVW